MDKKVLLKLPWPWPWPFPWRVENGSAKTGLKSIVVGKCETGFLFWVEISNRFLENKEFFKVDEEWLEDGEMPEAENNIGIEMSILDGLTLL